MVATPTHSKKKINTVNTHTHTHARARTQITLISVDSYMHNMTAMHCVVLIDLTFTTLQTRIFRVSWNVREASY